MGLGSRQSGHSLVLRLTSRPQARQLPSKSSFILVLYHFRRFHTYGYKDRVNINDPIFDFKNETIHISPSGDMASYSHKFDMTFTSQGGTEKLEGFRVSAVLVKEGSSWKHVQAHWSIGVKGQVVEY